MEQEKSQNCQDRKMKKNEAKKILAQVLAFSMAANAVSGYFDEFDKEEGENDNEKQRYGN